MDQVEYRPDIKTLEEAKAEHERTGKPITFGRHRMIASDKEKFENHSVTLIAYLFEHQPERSYVALRITAYDTANMAETAELGGKPLEWQGRDGREKNELLDTGEQFFRIPSAPPEDGTIKLTTKTGEVFTFNIW